MDSGFTRQAYEEALKELFRRFPSVQRDGFLGGAYKPGLERMREFDKLLGKPSEKLRCIHVAGTNGKGSVANMLASVLSANGYKTGLYTSPHLLDFRERMVMAPGPVAIPEEWVWDFLKRYESSARELDLSFFEITTGMAFSWFAESGAQWAVIECGLGGRLDSTNIITPELGIITSIGLDHCALLGNSRGEIAAEKAGIFKKGVPALCGSYDEETAPVFLEKAAAAGCPLSFADARPAFPFEEAVFARMDLQAPPQRQNLHTVLCALEILGMGESLSKEESLEALRNTASRMAFHGRWEKLGENPTVIADIGHNPAALKENFSRIKAPCTIVYGIMADKDLDSIIPLMPRGARYIFVAPDSPRSLPAQELLERFRRSRSEEACCAPSVADGVRLALKEEKNFIYIGGSAFVVAEALPALGKSSLV